MINDILAVGIGIVLGLLASIPIALVIAATTTPRLRRRVLDVPYAEIEPQETSVIVFEVAS